MRYALRRRKYQKGTRNRGQLKLDLFRVFDCSLLRNISILAVHLANQMVVRFDMICRGFDGIFPEAGGRTLFACVGFVTRTCAKQVYASLYD
jgi:hypothetical protein